MDGELDNKDAIATMFLNLAEERASSGDYGRAFLNYIVAIHNKPELKDELKTAATAALCNWGKLLESSSQYDAFLTVYNRAMLIFPDSEVIVNNLGSHLFRANHVLPSLKYFYKALQMNNNYLPAYSNLQNAKCQLVERWHFRMLNDTFRNLSYRRAINKKVKEDHTTVLDIGCGTGILSIYAKQAGADKVFGCDYSEPMLMIAKNVIQSSGYSSSITLLNKLSNDLLIPDDIPSRVSLVVTETFDAGLLGEHILETLIHAWEHLLLPNSLGENEKRIIPEAATLYITPIECLKIAKKNYIIKGSRLERQSFTLGIDLKELNLVSNFDEPYDTENLKQVPYTWLAQPTKLFTFDFNNLLELKKYYSGEITQNFKVEIIKDGYIDAFVVWFDLHLDDENVITSSPLRSCCCWEQAVFPLKEQWHVTEKNVISLSSSCSNGVLSIESFNSPLFCGDDENKLTTSQSILSFLNCEPALLNIIQLSNKINESLNEQSTILEVSCFPYLSILLALHNGCEFYFSNPNDEIIHEVENLLESLNLNIQFVLLNWSEVLELSEKKDRKFDVIYTDILEANGQINEEIICGFHYLRNLLSSEGLFIPSKLTVLGQFGFSEELSRSSQVIGSTDDLGIAEHINEFKTDQMIDMNIHETEYINRSNIFEITSISLFDWKNESYHFEQIQEIEKSGFVNCLLYWFRYCFLDEINIDTLSKDSYINHSAVILNSPIHVEDNSKLKVTLDMYTSIMRFHVKFAE